MKQGQKKPLSGNREKTSPLITVVTVVFNGEAHLEQTLKSVAGLPDDQIEYIVIDGGSSDRTIDIVRQYEDRITDWISEPDRGIYDAMNKGIAKANGQFIGFLNADDWYEPGILSDVARQITCSSSENRVIYFNYYWWDEELSTETRSPRQCNLRYWRGMSILHQTMFVQSSIYKELGSYSLEYRFASDYDYFLRMIKAGVRFEKINRHGVNFRKGGKSTKFMNRSISEVSRIVRKYFGTASREYALFLLTNRLPSLLGNLGNVFNKVIGKKNTVILRKIWRKMIFFASDRVEKEEGR
jgi:glycosyltransferase involved in cell wall biosynthesis